MSVQGFKASVRTLIRDLVTLLVPIYTDLQIISDNRGAGCVQDKHTSCCACFKLRNICNGNCNTDKYAGLFRKSGSIVGRDSCSCVQSCIPSCVCVGLLRTSNTQSLVLHSIVCNYVTIESKIKARTRFLLTSTTQQFTKHKNLPSVSSTYKQIIPPRLIVL